jgi:hypothetical protein
MGSLRVLIRRAQQTGKLRPDFVLDDLILLFMANTGVQPAVYQLSQIRHVITATRVR